jgi:hypothetical protein
MVAVKLVFERQAATSWRLRGCESRGGVRERSGFDIKWYGGLFLRRLREPLFAEPSFDEPYQDSFDHVTNTYQYDWIDLESAMTLRGSDGVTCC